jgi:hypothetical protein
MSGDVRNMVHKDALVGPPLVWLPTTAVPAYWMKPGDTCVIVATHVLTDGVAILVLPGVAEAAGRIYYISIPTVTGTGTGDVSLYVQENYTELTTNGDMDASDDYLFLYSDGMQWRTLVDGVA